MRINIVRRLTRLLNFLVAESAAAAKEEEEKKEESERSGEVHGASKAVPLRVKALNAGNVHRRKRVMEAFRLGRIHMYTFAILFASFLAISTDMLLLRRRIFRRTSLGHFGEASY